MTTPNLVHNPTRKLLSPFQVIRILGITRRTLHDLCSAGIVHANILSGICAQCVDQLLALKRESLRTYSETRHWRHIPRRRRKQVEQSDREVLPR